MEKIKMEKLQDVPTEVVELAIKSIKNKNVGVTWMFSYSSPSNADSNSCDRLAYTLPELYRELARRVEDSEKTLRNVLEEFKD